MILIKYFILILILITSIWIGLLISKKYKDRVIELKEFKNALNILENKIKFTYKPLQEIFDEMSENLISSISQIFKNTSNNMKELGISSSWNNSIKNSKLNLNKEDLDIIESFGKDLGKTDLEGQISKIELTSSFIDMQIEKAEKDREKNEKLYKTVGTVIGLAIVIILV